MAPRNLQVIGRELGAVQAQRDRYAGAPLSSFAAGNLGDRFATPEEAKAATVAEYDQQIESLRGEIETRKQYEASEVGERELAELERGSAEQQYFNEARAKGVSVDAIRDQGTGFDQSRAEEYVRAKQQMGGPLFTSRPQDYTPLGVSDYERAGFFGMSTQTGATLFKTPLYSPLQANLSTPQGERFAFPYVPNMSLATNSKVLVGDSYYSTTEAEQARFLMRQKEAENPLLAGITLRFLTSTSPFGGKYVSSRFFPSPETEGKDYKLQYVIETQRNFKRSGYANVIYEPLRSPVVQAGALFSVAGVAARGVGLAAPSLSARVGKLFVGKGVEGALAGGVGISIVAEGGKASYRAKEAGYSPQEQTRAQFEAYGMGLATTAASAGGFIAGYKLASRVARVPSIEYTTGEVTRQQGYRPKRTEFTTTNDIVLPRGSAVDLFTAGGGVKRVTTPAVKTLTTTGKRPFTLGSQRLGAKPIDQLQFGEVGGGRPLDLAPRPKGAGSSTGVGERPLSQDVPFTLGTKNVVLPRGRGNVLFQSKTNLNTLARPSGLRASVKPYGVRGTGLGEGNPLFAKNDLPLGSYSRSMTSGGARRSLGQIKTGSITPIRRVTSTGTATSPTVVARDRPFSNELQVRSNALRRSTNRDYFSGAKGSQPEFYSQSPLRSAPRRNLRTLLSDEGGYLGGSRTQTATRQVGEYRQGTRQRVQRYEQPAERTSFFARAASRTYESELTSGLFGRGLVSLTQPRTQQEVRTRTSASVKVNPRTETQTRVVTLPSVVTRTQPTTRQNYRTSTLQRLVNRPVLTGQTVTIQTQTTPTNNITTTPKPTGGGGFIFGGGGLPPLGFGDRSSRRFKSRAPKRRYVPSLVGLFSGKTINKQPRLLTGGEIRYPVARRRK